MPLLLYLHLMLLAGSPIVAIDLRLLLNFKVANLFANRCKPASRQMFSCLFVGSMRHERHKSVMSIVMNACS
jgi:hypothetical protein